MDVTALFLEVEEWRFLPGFCGVLGKGAIQMHSKRMFGVFGSLMYLDFIQLQEPKK